MANNANLYGSGATSDDMARTALVDRQKDPENRPKSDPLMQRYWREIERYNKASSEWSEEGENIIKVYMDEERSRSTRRFALLWANTETLKPAVYTKTPTVQCTRRYRDRDLVARTAAELMERATNTTFELYGVDEIFRMVRDDRLLPGRGTAWVRYDAVIDQIEETVMVFDEAKGIEIEQTETREKLRSEKACVDYVHWQDFGHNVARTWSDVWLVWRWVYKTQDEVADRFGGKVAAQLTYNAKAPAGDGSRPGSGPEDSDEFCRICEIWDRQRGLTSWMAEGQQEFLESGAPPINFSNFFPCPEPVYATKTSKSLIPKPDYCYYRDQAKEINDLTDKIGRLTEWLIVKGFIPGGPSTVSDPLEEAIRDKGNRELFVQVDSMTEWTEKGGTSKLIDWLPLQPIIAAIQASISARAQLIQDVFQITGIADVLRGQSDPDETLGAVELRAQTGSRRLRNTKDDIARFCRDIARLTAEVIAENFSPQSIAEITGFRYEPPQPQMPMPANMTNVAMFPGVPAPMQQQMQPMMAGMGHNGGPAMQQDDEPGLTFDDRVMELLRSDRMRGFRVDVETDSTVQADENAERRSRTEFVDAAGAYLERAVKIVQTAPSLAKTAGELLMFAARGYRAGRNLEETLERDFNALVRQLEQAASAPPREDPVVQVAKVQVAGEIENNRVKAKLEAQKQQTDAALEVRKQDLDAQIEIRQQNMNAAAKAQDIASRMAGRLSRIGPMANGVDPTSQARPVLPAQGQGRTSAGR
jgi:hypothetical protein